MKRVLFMGIIGIMLFTVTSCSGDKSQNANAAANTVKKIQEKQTVEAFGVIKAPDVKNIIIDFPAAIAKLNIKEGQKTRRGDSLIILDITDYQFRISSRERQVSTEKFELQRLLNTTLGDQKELRRLQNELATKQTSLKNGSEPDMLKALNDLKTQEDLYSKALQELSSKEVLCKSGALSQYELDEFKKTIEARRKAVEDAKYSIEISKSSKQKDIDQLQSNIDQKLTQLDNVQSNTEINLIRMQREKIAGLEEEVKQMKDKLNKTYIKQNDIISDVDNGLVFDLGYVQGDLIDQSKKLLSLMNLDSIVVEANVAEEFIKDVKTGAEVTIIPQADKSRIYKGKVFSISDKAVQKNGETNVLVQIAIENKDSFLLPDFNVDVKINVH